MPGIRARSPVFSQPVSRQCRNAFRMQSLLHSNATISDGSMSRLFLNLTWLMPLSCPCCILYRGPPYVW